MEFERVRLQSVVRSLRTTDGKRTPSTSVMRAFAPPEKTLRRGLEHAGPCMRVKGPDDLRQSRDHLRESCDDVRQGRDHVCEGGDHVCEGGDHVR